MSVRVNPCSHISRKHLTGRFQSWTAAACAAATLLFGTVPQAAAQTKALPGTIQAEDFDAGGNGSAYRDTTTGNTGGKYRSTDVDIESTPAGGYDVGWVAAGEWLKYTVNVATAGTYDLDIRVGSAVVGGTFHIEVDGVDKTGPISVPNTGGWQTWQTIRVSGVTLAAGTQVWRVVMDTNGSNTTSVGNFNWLQATLR